MPGSVLAEKLKPGNSRGQMESAGPRVPFRMRPLVAGTWVVSKPPASCLLDISFSEMNRPECLWLVAFFVDSNTAFVIDCAHLN